MGLLNMKMPLRVTLSLVPEKCAHARKSWRNGWRRVAHSPPCFCAHPQNPRTSSEFVGANK